MKKLLKLFDDHVLKFGVAFAILFTALYPKLPSINIVNTWVYIRLEDFLILALAVLWLIQLVRRKVSLPRPEGYAVIGYWLVGLASLLYCFAFIAPTLANFFPHVAGLQYFRRIEYMILFFIAFSTIRSVKDVHFYLITLCVTVLGIVLYGFGQRFYFLLWQALPDFFLRNPFCFPAFLTGNEEFAKGVPLCLNDTSRITSTFGGHYDLSAYLVLVIPVLIGLAFTVKRWYLKISLILLSLFSLELLNFTSSRTSFAAYVIGVTMMLIFWKKKRWIVPILAVSVGVMLLFGNSTIQRFSKTIQQVQVVTVEQQVPEDLQQIIAETKKSENVKKPEVPPPSDFTVGQTQQAGSASSYTTVLTDEQLKRLQSGDVAISTVSGSFLVKKAYALDISFTTRFQGEWPRNWNAFLSSPVFGTGYSSLTLATDNDYLRALGETGLAGLMAFLLVFIILGIFMKETVGSVKDNVTKGLLYGLVGGTIGLLINAILIDVFEASKVAEPFWILMGIGVGAAKLYHPQKIAYKKELAKLFTSRFMVVIYFLLIVLIAYAGGVANFFVGSDFTTLRWAASASPADMLLAFTQFQASYYQPLSSALLYGLYMLFSFQPEGYHWVVLIFHFLTVIALYHILAKMTGNKIVGFFSAMLFAVLPVHTENIYWFSNFSVIFGSFLTMYAVLAFVLFRKKKWVIAYIASIILSILAFLAHPVALIIPFAVIIVDLVFRKEKRSVSTVLAYTPFVVLFLAYLLIRVSAGINIAEMVDNGWIYLTSAAGSFVLVYLLSLALRSVIKNTLIYFIVLGVLIGAAVVFSVTQTIQEQTNWRSAGTITKTTLAYIRVAHPNFAPEAKIVFIDTPYVKKDVPVFEDGLIDSIWFIYRDDSPQIVEVPTLEEARKVPTSLPQNRAIFEFKDGGIAEVQ